MSGGELIVTKDFAVELARMTAADARRETVEAMKRIFKGAHKDAFYDCEEQIDAWLAEMESGAT